MDPQIQYASASGGANIAFWQIGDGWPVIEMPSMPFTHIQMEWADPHWRNWYLSLSGEDIRVIRYDTRGCGLSWAAECSYSLEEMVNDLEAVADRANCGRFGLIAPVQAGPAALVYAARNPDRVDRIVLWCAVSRGDELRTSSFEALRKLSHTDWALFSEAAAHAVVAGWDNAEAAHGMAGIMRQSSSAAIHDALMDTYLMSDISSELARVRCPVLVSYRTEGRAPLPASARYLAAALKHARMMPFPGASLLFVVSDAPAIASAFREFLLARGGDGASTPESRFQTLLYTDIEGHTAIMQQLGDDRGRQVLREHERITRSAIERYGGHEALTTGDGFLVRFSAAHHAVRCATELQHTLADVSIDLPVELRVRIGINAGEPIVEGDDVHGAVVFAAKRIAGVAGGGEVIVANVVRDLVSGNGFAFKERGELVVSGQEEPVRLWELLWAHTAS